MEPAEIKHVAATAWFWIGMIQMAGAAFALALLVLSGLSLATLVVVALATMVSLTSLVVRRQKENR